MQGAEARVRKLPNQRSVRVRPPPPDYRRLWENSVIFAGQSRDQLRETYRGAWRRFKGQHTLSPLDKLTAMANGGDGKAQLVVGLKYLSRSETACSVQSV